MFDEHQREAARRVCHLCPVRAECLEYALLTRPAAGVWAGLTVLELARERRARRQAARLGKGPLDGSWPAVERRNSPATIEADRPSELTVRLLELLESAGNDLTLEDTPLPVVLAEMLGASERGVRNVLARLERLGDITLERTTSNRWAPIARITRNTDP